MRVRLVLLAAVIGLAAGVVWLAITASRQNARIASLEAQLRVPRVVAAPAPAAVVPPGDPEPNARPAPPTREPKRETSGPQQNAEAERLTERLQESQAALTKVQARVDELESKVQEMTGDRARLVSSEADARGQITELHRRLEEISSERAAVDKRLRDLETENTRLRDQGTAATQRTGQIIKLLADWQDLGQRQQVYLANAIRRYRELTDLFRRMPGMLELKGNGPELARIQNAVSMADEDLRQLNDLGVRLGRVQKQIAAVR